MLQQITVTDILLSFHTIVYLFYLTFVIYENNSDIFKSELAPIHFAVCRWNLSLDLTMRAMSLGDIFCTQSSSSDSPTQLTSKKQIIDPVRERLFSIQGRRMVGQARLAMVVIAD
jgi:hypothetical protein